MSCGERINRGRTFVFLDLETTGTSFSEDRIIEVGALRLEDGRVSGRFRSLILCDIPIPLAVRRLTGITPEEIQESGRMFADIAPALREFLGEHPVVCHNAPFEQGFLAAYGMQPANEFLDTCELACILLPTLSDHSLPTLCRTFGICGRTAHRAVSDCENTAAVWTALWDSVKPGDLAVIRDINRWMEASTWPFAEFFTELEKILETEQEPGVPTRSPVEKRGPGPGEFVPYDPACRVPLDTDRITRLFDEEGPLARGLPEYENRPQQKEMAEAVCEAFNTDRHLCVEAGTGTGKSLAYLVPAVYWAVSNRTRVVVSTNTRNLQDQLWKKEIPFLSERLGIQFSAALMKGRENYLCLSRWRRLFENTGTLFESERRALLYLLVWRHRTEDGLLEDVSGWYARRCTELPELVSRVHSEKTLCLERFCPFRSQCFYQRARSRARQAHLIISNHALTLDPPRWFPPFRHVVFDEAHNLEDAATELFSREVSSVAAARLLGEIIGGDERRGRLNAVWSLVRRDASGDLRQRLLDLRKTALAQAGEIRETEMADFSEAFLSLFGKARSGDFPQESRVLSLKDLKEAAGWDSLREAGRALCLALADLSHTLEQIEGVLAEMNLDAVRAREAVGTVRSLTEQAGQMCENLRFVLEGKKPDFIRWAGLLPPREGLPQAFYLKAAPVEVGPFLRDLYEEKAGVVLTSATLTVSGRFDFLHRRLGLDRLGPDRVLGKVLGSPFDYRGRVLLEIPRDFPSFDHRDPGEFIRALAQEIVAVARSVRGKILVLFNSVSRMREIHDAVRPLLEQEQILVMCQYVDGSRRALVERMKETDGDAVLMGTRSFREGVDISGLSGVVLEKLPFPNPNDPVIRGRKEFMEAHGEDPWSGYLIPLTTIALRQGFGRLMRKKTDRGRVVIFDPRLHTDFRNMRRSLPACSEGACGWCRAVPVSKADGAERDGHPRAGRKR